MSPAIVLWAAIAHADPVVTRAPTPGAGTWVGLDGLGIAAPVAPGLSVGVDLPWNAASVTATASARWAPGRGIVRFTLAGGVVVPTTVPGLAFEVTPGAAVGWSGRAGAVSVGLAAPIAAGVVGAPVARIPVVAEVFGAVRLGPAQLGAGLRAGAAWTPGLDTAILFDPGLFLVIPFAADRVERANAGPGAGGS